MQSSTTNPISSSGDKVYKAVTKYTTLTVVAKPTTPPQSSPPFTASFQQTPWTFNTSSFADTSDLRRDVDPILKGEVEGNLIINHLEFFDIFFGQVPRLGMAAAVFQMCKDTEPPLYKESIGWVEWLEGCEKPRVLSWLRRHIDQFLLFANERGYRPLKRRRCVTTPNKPIPGYISKRKLDAGFAYDSSDRLPYNWSHILVPSELKSNPREDNYSSTWLDLLRYARGVRRTRHTTVHHGLYNLWFNHAAVRI